MDDWDTEITQPVSGPRGRGCGRGQGQISGDPCLGSPGRGAGHGVVEDTAVSADDLAPPIDASVTTSTSSGPGKDLGAVSTGTGPETVASAAVGESATTVTVDEWDTPMTTTTISPAPKPMTIEGDWRAPSQTAAPSNEDGFSGGSRGGRGTGGGAGIARGGRSAARGGESRPRRPPHPDDWRCPEEDCNGYNYSTRNVCFRCNAPKPLADDQAPSQLQETVERKKKKKKDKKSKESKKSRKSKKHRRRYSSSSSSSSSSSDCSSCSSSSEDQHSKKCRGSCRHYPYVDQRPYGYPPSGGGARLYATGFTNTAYSFPDTTVTGTSADNPNFIQELVNPQGKISTGHKPSTSAPKPGQDREIKITPGEFDSAPTPVQDREIKISPGEFDLSDDDLDLQYIFD